MNRPYTPQNNQNGGGHHHKGRPQHHSGHNQRMRPRPSGSKMPSKSQAFDSNGPDVRIRGTAYQILEKYISLARDAQSCGDIVLAENYHQHAEHYQRMIQQFAQEEATYRASVQQEEPQPAVATPQPTLEADDAFLKAS